MHLALLLLLASPALAAKPEPELIRRPEPELVQPTKKSRSSSPLRIPRAELSDDLRARIRDAALRAALDPKLVEAVVRVESNGSRTATSHKGAMGLMQVIPSTAEECGIHDPYNTVSNLMGASVCLRKLINRYRGKLPLALAAYNAGPGNVSKYGGIPPFDETEKYVARVLAIYGDLKKRR